MNIGIKELAKIGNITMPNTTKQANDSSVFNNFYQSAIGMLNETNQLQKNAEQMGLNFAIGKIDNIHDVMIAQEKANIALQYTVKIKNEVMTAYNEIMRMQL